MGKLGQGIHPLAVDQDIQFNQITGPVVNQLVIKRAITLGHGFELIIKIIDHLSQGQLTGELNPSWHGVMVVGVLAPSLHAQGHDCAHITFWDQDGGLDKGFFNPGNGTGIRKMRRVFHSQFGLILEGYLIAYRGNREDQGNVKLPLQPLLNHFEVEQSQKAAAKTKAQRG
ncbi:hypothetical protein GKODMF_04320 [Candidatus Electrothrix gigas]